MRVLCVLALCAILGGCGEAAENGDVEKKEAPTPARTIDAASDLSLILNGGSVAWRSGEASLEFSAIHAFDGTDKTAWTTPPLAMGAPPPHATAIVALPAKCRVTAVSITNATTFRHRATQSIAISPSMDGKTFGDRQTIAPKDLVLAERFPLVPADAKYVRVELMDQLKTAQMLDLPSLAIHGDRLEKVSPRRLEGTYEVLGSRGSFRQEHSRVRAEIAMDPPMQIDGAWHGPTLRFAWTRGNKRGIGIITAPDDGSTFSGLTWFESASSISNAWPLFAKRVDASTLPVETSVIRQHLARDRRAPLPQIAIDGEEVLAAQNESILKELRALVELNPQAGFRIVAASVLGETEPERLAHARRRIDSLARVFGPAPPNLEFQAIAAPSPHESSDYLLARTMNSGFRLELRQ
jgi:hypothetical protein